MRVLPFSKYTFIVKQVPRVLSYVYPVFNRLSTRCRAKIPLFLPPPSSSFRFDRYRDYL